MSKQTSLGQFLGASPSSALSKLRDATQAENAPKKRPPKEQNLKGKKKKNRLESSSSEDERDEFAAKKGRSGLDSATLVKAPKAKKAKTQLPPTPPAKNENLTASQYFAQDKAERNNKKKEKEKSSMTTTTTKDSSPEPLLPSTHQSSTTSHSASKKETMTNKSPSKVKKQDKTPSKSVEKAKVEEKGRKKSPRTPALSEEEKARRRRESVGGYQSYLHRAGPEALGSKELPVGDDDCLAGLKFLVTGVLESIERETAHDLIKRHGGQVMGSLSKRTSYVIVGREAGEAKKKKIKEFDLKTLDEDGFFYLIRSRSKGKREEEKSKKQPVKEVKEEAKKTESLPRPETKRSEMKQAGIRSYSAWVDKYKPKKMSEIVGQQGDRSAVRKLEAWLKAWPRWHGPAATKKAPWNSPDGADKKAALLSGPPGIGKTTAAHLVSASLGLTVLELNASDTRKATQLRSSIAPTLENTSMDFFARKDYSPSSSESKEGGRKQVLIMDEVDGMAGNEDRAGIGELIAMIKTAKFPIICICNDRQAQKIRTLANYTYDLRFAKPRVESLRSRVLSIASQEGLTLSAPAADQLIQGANCDIRQVIQHLQLLAAGTKAMDYDSAKAAAGAAQKDLSVSLFEAARELLSGPGRGDWMRKKTELFFHDYSLMPLFVHENYPHLRPRQSKGRAEDLATLARAASSICAGDRVDALLRRTQNWSLLNTECALSSLCPVGEVDGFLGGAVAFPTWLGRNSTENRRRRLLSGLSHHSALAMGASESALSLDYLHFLRDRLTRPLLEQEEKGAGAVQEVLAAYAFQREDLDSVCELATFSARDPLQGVAAKAKAALTRAINAAHTPLPYSIQSGLAGKRKKPRNEDSLDAEAAEGGGEKEEDEGEDEDFNLEAFRAKAKTKKASSSSSAAPSKSKKSKKK